MKPASKFEIVDARCWNVLNEGKSFHPVFVLGIFLLLHVFELGDAGFWGQALPALLLTAPIVLVFVYYDFPLKLRWALWGFLALLYSSSGSLTSRLWRLPSGSTSSSRSSSGGRSTTT